ncbi:MAG: branched-chain amino acid ABC transporter permease [Thermodesulfobacteriota bacterium]|jgi:branched-chain amino acid transport system permease protein
MGILILSLFLNGIGLGLVYAAVAIGFSLVLGVSGVINFSHGIMYAFGAYFFWILYGNIGFWPALAITPVFVAIIGFVIERALVRRVYGLDPLFGLVITLGFATAMEEVIRMIFGPAAYSVSAPSFAKGIFLIGDFAYPQYRLFIAVMAAAMLAGVWLLIDRTNFGAVVKAGMFNSEMVGALGNNLPLLRTSVFILGAALAGLSGILAAPIWSIKSQMGTLILMPSFVIVLMGGLGSIPGTIIGGLLVGVSTSLATLIIPRFVDIIPYLLMGVIIYFRPRGLFGEQNIAE